MSSLFRKEEPSSNPSVTSQSIGNQVLAICEEGYKQLETDYLNASPTGESCFLKRKEIAEEPYGPLATLAAGIEADPKRIAFTVTNIVQPVQKCLSTLIQSSKKANVIDFANAVQLLVKIVDDAYQLAEEKKETHLHAILKNIRSKLVEAYGKICGAFPEFSPQITEDKSSIFSRLKGGIFKGPIAKEAREQKLTEALATHANSFLASFATESQIRGISAAPILR